MIEASVAAVVRTHVDAFNSCDLDALMAGFTDDAEWVTGTTLVRGRTELHQFFAAAMAGLLPTLRIENLVVDDDRAACELVETITTDGQERTFPIAGFYTIRDGRIAKAKIYREGSAEVPSVDP